MFFFQYNINDVIRRETAECFKVLVNDDFYIPDEYKTRDFAHLFPFQKFYIYNSLERLKELVHLKQEQDWRHFKQKHSSWQDNGTPMILHFKNNLYIYKI